MTTKISRRRRAELARAAHQIRARGQRAGWPVARIAAVIQTELPEVLPLEAWRWAYGWSRAQTVRMVAGYYQTHQLGTARLNESMLCRWEHGDTRPGPDYAAALCGVYGTDPAQLGLWPTWRAAPHQPGRYGAWGTIPAPKDGYGYPMHSLAALRESVELTMEVEGPAGGPQTIEAVQAAVTYYDLHYSKWAPNVLAAEVHRTRALVGNMLRHDPPTEQRTDLRRLAGWLSAIAGNLAFHLADTDAAAVHLATAERLGAAAGDTWLQCWALGARSMVAHHHDRHAEAIELAQRAHQLANTPLRRAQMLAWGQLRPTAALGLRDEVTRIAAAARDAMAADPNGDQPGRTGFDLAELQLHLAEASLTVGDHAAARRYADTSTRSVPRGRPGWAAATLVLARAEAARGRFDDAAALATEVLDEIPAASLRSTTRTRLTLLDADIATRAPSRVVRDLHERVASLPELTPLSGPSDEPNGTET